MRVQQERAMRCRDLLGGSAGCCLDVRLLEGSQASH